MEKETWRIIAIIFIISFVTATLLFDLRSNELKSVKEKLDSKIKWEDYFEQEACIMGCRIMNEIKEENLSYDNLIEDHNICALECKEIYEQGSSQ